MRQKQTQISLTEKLRRHEEVLRDQEAKRKKELEAREKRETDKIQRAKKRKDEVLRGQIRRWSEKLLRVKDRRPSPIHSETSKVLSNRVERARGTRSIMERREDAMLDGRLSSITKKCSHV